MKFVYRTEHNARAVAAFWGKPIDKPDWWRIEAETDELTEILVYSVIGWPYVDIREIVSLIKGAKKKPVKLRICSPGGDVIDTMALANVVMEHGNVTTVNDSLAGSAASFLFTSGKKRESYKNSMIMIHDPFCLAVGNQFELRETADLLQQFSENMVDMYADTTSVGKRELRDMLKVGTWMNAKVAKEKGFVDTLLDGKGVKAQFDLSMYANVPDNIDDDSQGRELTRKETERALRNAGASRGYARALAAKRADASEDDNQVEEDNQNAKELTEYFAYLKTLSIIGGK